MGFLNTTVLRTNAKDMQSKIKEKDYFSDY